QVDPIQVDPIQVDPIQEESNPGKFTPDELYIQKIRGLITELSNKADDLNGKTANAAKATVQKLTEMVNKYKDNLDIDRLQVFKAEAKELLKDDTADADVQELRKHTGLKALIVGILSAILSTNMAQSLFARFTWFQTSSAIHLNSIAKEIASAETPDVPSDGTPVETSDEKLDEKLDETPVVTPESEENQGGDSNSLKL
ncbi:MAG: hypothetical protein ACRC0M_11720, partial [Legionella sp.]